MKTVWAIIFCILVCAACQRGKNETSELKIFQCPVIVNNSNGGAVIKGEFESNEIAAVYPLRFGKYKFTDTIYYSNCTSEVPVTDLREEGEIYRAMDTFDTNGFELIVDYEQTFYLPARHHFQDTLVYPYYPVYFVNSGPNDKLLLGKDSHVFGIQEAENKFNSDRWQPIEYRGYDFCGNGVWGVIVHPGEFYMVLMKKYKGEIKT